MTRVKNTLLIANFDSNVGYAWTLIEDFWIAIHKENKKMGRDSIICYPSISVVAPKIEQEKIIILPHDFNKKGAKNLLQNIRFIIKNKIDTLYITDQKKRSYKYAIYRIFGVKKIIVHDHSPGTRKDQNAITAKIKKYFANIIHCFTCDAAFAVSPYIAKRLHEVNALSKNKIYEITNGIKIREAPRKITSKDTVNIVSVARLTPYKGIDFSLNVVAKTIQKLSSIELHYYVIGDGPELNSLVELAKQLGISNAITFTGKLDHSAVIETLEKCDVAFHPSKGEAMSLAILEYMQTGLAVLTSNNPSVCSAFENNKEGVTYQENNLADAAEKLHALILSDALRMELGRAARNKVVSHFSDEIMMQKLIAAYSKVMSA